MSHPHKKYETNPKLYLAFIFIVLIALPGALMALMHIAHSPVAGAIIFGISIFAAATVLAWAAEVAQMDMSQALAVTILALVAVLPEYAVDIVFTWKAGLGDEPSHHYAIANMTGANRLLVGLGWPVILFLFIWAKKKKEVLLKDDQRLEVFYISLAALYAFIVVLKGSLTIFDTLILVSIYGFYSKRSASMESPEPDLVGPVKIVANLNKLPRRNATALMFAFAGLVIFFVAEPFAESLVSAGEVLGIDKFLLVQWLAPIASEMPEFIIAATWTLRGEAASSIKALSSSLVNQFTLLVGSIPLVYSLAAGHVSVFELDSFQKHEIFLTAAQCVFGAAVLVSLRLSRTSGILLLLLFLAQLIVPGIRVEAGVVYLVFAVIYLFKRRLSILPAIKTGIGMK
ncbi:MAG TPA: sodium:calcium antiporter [candidate division Zixibacteria bacterium]|nr:sodium:calcium antiporter [candidate division Zixibacteria bacterium]